MTTPELDELTTPQDEDDDGLCHFWCCDPAVAWCGKPLTVELEDLTAGVDESEDPNDCALCVLAGETETAVCKYCNPKGSS
jgi:hypothetical protein